MKVEIGDPHQDGFHSRSDCCPSIPSWSCPPCLCWAVLKTLKPAPPIYFPISSSHNNIQQKAVSSNIPTYKDLKCKNTRNQLANCELSARECFESVHKSHIFNKTEKESERKKKKLSVPSGGKTYIKMSKVIWPHPDHFRPLHPLTTHSL